MAYINPFVPGSPIIVLAPTYPLAMPNPPSDAPELSPASTKRKFSDIAGEPSAPAPAPAPAPFPAFTQEGYMAFLQHAMSSASMPQPFVLPQLAAAAAAAATTAAATGGVPSPQLVAAAAAVATVDNIPTVALDSGDRVVEVDPTLPGPPPAPKLTGTAQPPAPPVIVIRMLTGTLTNPGTAMTIGARDTILRGLEVGALLGASRTNRGSLALNAIHLWSDYKAATGDILFPQERLDAYLAFVDRCIFPAFQQLGGVFDGDTSAEALVANDAPTQANDPAEAPDAQAAADVSAGEPQASSSTTTARRRGRPPKAQSTAEQNDTEDNDNKKGKKPKKSKSKAPAPATSDQVIDVDA